MYQSIRATGSWYQRNSRKTFKGVADAHINTFAISTYDTDYILVNAEKIKEAVAALKDAGYQFES